MDIYPPGSLIAGQYEVAGRPLMGGMGVVYLCFDHQEQRPVALKTFRPELLPDRAARDRFLREGTHWVELGAHPHVVRCYRVLYFDLEVYLVLELIARAPGKADASLRAWLAPGTPLEIGQTLLFALQVARGMAYAGTILPGFIHRDLKPENILVGADHLSNIPINRLRITDFGLAAVLQSVDPQSIVSPVGDDPSPISASSAAEALISKTPGPLGRTQLTQGRIGTPLYMAPEQWRGEQVTVATDVYALGCILHEMLTGEHAAVGSSVPALEYAHCAGELRPLPKSVPNPVRETVTRCLALEPAARYASWPQVETVLMNTYAEVVGHSTLAEEPLLSLGLNERVAAGWSYNSIGTSYLDIGKADIALRYFERAWTVGKEVGIHELEGTALTYLGMAHVELGDAHRAIKYHEQALTVLRDSGSRTGESFALSGLGEAYRLRGKMSQAIRCHEKSLAIDRETGNRRSEAKDLGNLGNVYKDLGDTRRANGYYEQQLSIVQRIGDRLGEASVLGNLGGTYIDSDEITRGRNYCEQSLAICREIGYRWGEAAGLGNLGTVCLKSGQARQGIGYYEQAVAIWHEIGSQLDEAADLANLGKAYFTIGDTRRAIANLESAARIWAGVGSPQAQMTEQLVAQIRAASRSTVGDLESYVALLSSHLEKKCLDETAEEFDGIVREHAEWAQLHFDIFDRLVKQGQGDMLRQAFEEAIGRRPGHATACYGLGLVLQSADEQDSAILHFRQAAQLDPQLAPAAYHNIGVAYLTKRELNEAIVAAREAVHRSSTIAEPHYLLGVLWESRGDRAKSLKHFQKFVDLAPPYLSTYVNNARMTIMMLGGTTSAREPNKPWWQFWK